MISRIQLCDVAVVEFKRKVNFHRFLSSLKNFYMPFLAVQRSASYIETNSAVLQSDSDGLPVYRSLGPSSLREEIGQTSSIQLILCKLFDNRTQRSYNSSDGLALLSQHLCCAKFLCPLDLIQGY